MRELGLPKNFGFCVTIPFGVQRKQDVGQGMQQALENTGDNSFVWAN